MNIATADVKTKQDFIEFLNALRHDFAQNKSTWENWDLEAFLEAIEAWLTDSTEKSLVVVDFTPSWELIAAIFYMGKVYE